MMTSLSYPKLIKDLYEFIDLYIAECKDEYLPEVVSDNGFVESKCIFTLGDLVLAVTFDGGRWAYEIGVHKVSPEFGALFHNRVLDRLKELKLERSFVDWLTESNKDLELKHYRIENAISDLIKGKEFNINI